MDRDVEEAQTPAEAPPEPLQPSGSGGNDDMDVPVTAEDTYNLPATRRGRKRRLPRRFRDEPPPPAPHVPVPTTVAPDIPDVPPPPLPIEALDLAAQGNPSFKTEANSYGIYRLYVGGWPSIYPTSRSTVEMYHSPIFETTQNGSKRPWWAVFGKSLKAVLENLYTPFQNVTTYLLMYWANTGTNSKSDPELDRLAEILQDPRFDLKDLRGFRAEREGKRLDSYTDSGIGTKSLFNTDDGWIGGSVEIPLPREGLSQKENLAPRFKVDGVFYCKPLEVLKSALQGPAEKHMHWFPYQEYWKPSDDAEPERIYSELYNSDAFIHEHQRLNEQMDVSEGPRPRMEAVIASIMLWSDSTHLASFGTASLWPIYMFVGNQSKYIRSKTSLLTAQHLAYIPKLSDTFQDFYKQVFGVPATNEVIKHCKREIMHLIWLLILDDEFMHAYVHGFDYLFCDGTRRLVFPRLFTYAADYPEKILLACIKYLGKRPCPRCLIVKGNISDMGKKVDMDNRSKSSRIDGPETQSAIANVRRAVFDTGMSFTCQFVDNIIGDKCWTSVRSAFSTRFYEYGFNHYNMLVPDLLHEFELGVWKLLRILYANGGDTIQELNKRYRLVSPFGGTIRGFSSNASGMKKLAARDFEDLLQCAIPVFDGLLPAPHDKIVKNLLFELATWHALAKLRLHTESTLRSLETSTKRLGAVLREFKKVTCAVYITKELPSEEAARGRRYAALRSQQAPQPAPEVARGNSAKAGKQEKQFNLSTYKLHALGDYPAAIRMFGTSDGYTSQVGETQHKTVKKYYSRASKAHPTQSIAKRQRRERTLHKIAHRNKAAEANSNIDEHRPTKRRRKRSMLDVEDEENLPYTDPEVHYHISSDKKDKVNIYSWLDEELEEDIAYKNWYPRLLDHLLARLKGIELYDGDENIFTDAERCSIKLVNDAVYKHKVLRVNYTTYDLLRDQDSINPRINADVMIAAHEDDPGQTPHPYWYARVIGIFHADVIQRGLDDSLPTRMDFLWVRWYGRDLTHRGGWKTRRLHRIGFVERQDPSAFGFLDPEMVIRSVHLIPAFSQGRTMASLPASTNLPPTDEDLDWQQYYVNMFCDRDMVMRFRGGGVGHKSTREETDQFLNDRHVLDVVGGTSDVDDETMEDTEEQPTEDVEEEEADYGYADEEDEAQDLNESPQMEDEADDLGLEGGGDDDDDGNLGYDAL
ncbi:hypothetical protein M378DRAFT_19051 [Amanita muscaria Koide BX008]|uniref:Uncharacterized protein n=1 Tax=Amanita muscaria (strain Koide BX008) TaxID=946122 RepID=A0A0C2SK23_AMAMK|nr:hypothetical protein M378DRAFT_19051 [Amanita muscaria Koide BX008]